MNALHQLSPAKAGVFLTVKFLFVAIEFVEIASAAYRAWGG
jgi:hypothetical protein